MLEEVLVGVVVVVEQDGRKCVEASFLPLPVSRSKAAVVVVVVMLVVFVMVVVS